MAWDIMTVTTKGTELLASASASDQLTIVGCDADSTVYSTVDSAKAVSTRPVSPLRNTTDVTILFTQNNNLFSRAYFGTGTSATSDVNTLYLYGKLDSSEDLYVVAVASSSATTHLPVSGDPSESFQALFNFMYNVPNTAAVTASSASFATIAEFNDLASRVVTTNIQGSETTGENQNIRGEKAFLNRLYANGGITSNSSCYVYSALGVGYNNQSYMLFIQYIGGSISTVAKSGYSRICTKDSGQDDGTAIMRLGTWTSGGGYNYYLELVKETRYQDFPSGFYWDFGACGIFREGIKFNGTILPDAAATPQGYADVKVGIPSQPIAEIHAKYVHAKNTLYTDELSTEGSGDQITLDAIGFNRIDSDEVFSGASTITNSGMLEINNNNSTVSIQNSGVFNFTSNSGYKFQFNGGVEFNPAYSSGDVVFGGVGFKIKTTDANDPVEIGNQGIFRGASTDFSIGTLDKPIKNTNAQNVYVETGVYCNTYGGASNQSVGTSQTPFENIYGKRLHGVINYPVEPTGSSTVVTVPVGAIVCIRHAGITGKTFTIANNTSVYECFLDGTQGLYTVSAGTYVALSSQTNNNGALLAMRIA